MRSGINEFLYFRAFLKPQSVSEIFTPEWQSERFFGRVDQVPTYQGTTRTINLAFDVVAWSPADLKVMWKKLYKLQSMVYPTFDTKGFIEAGPVVRMRVGDLFAATSGQGGAASNIGLPGYISALDFAYDDGIWNIAPNLKVPRKVSVTLSFVVIHNGNPGIYKYQSANFNITTEANDVRGDGGPTFGVGTFTTGQNSTEVQARVSVSEIRKIFETVRGQS